MSQSRDTGEGRPYLWGKAGVIINVVLAVLTFGVLIAAIWAACAASSAVDEAKSMRFADNRPAFLIKPSENIQEYAFVFFNLGKGPAIMTGIEYSYDKVPWSVKFTPEQRYFVPPSPEAPILFPWYTLDEFAKKYAKNKGIEGVGTFHDLKSKHGEVFSNKELPIRCAVLFTDIFEKAEYRQFFFYYPLKHTVAFSNFETETNRNAGE